MATLTTRWLCSLSRTGRHDDTIDADNGNDRVYAGSGHDTVFAGTGGDAVFGEGGNDRLYGQEGDDVLDGGSGTDLLDGGNGDDTLQGGAGADRLVGGNGNDVLVGGSGNDTLMGGSGDDTYRFGIGDGQDLLVRSDATSGSNDTLAFDAGIDPLDVILQRSGDDLRLSLYGTNDLFTVSNWYGGAANQIETIQAGSGEHLLNSQVDQLIQAMAGFTAQTGLSWEEGIAQRPKDVQAILAASWE